MITHTERMPAVASPGPVVTDLARLLADTTTIYLKTHGYHWNVTGPHFPSLHSLFEDQYTELHEAVDEIAERIRTLGGVAPGSWAQLVRLAIIVEDEGAPEAMEMVRRLAADHERLIATARTLLRARQPTTSQRRTSPPGASRSTRRCAGCCA